jgi:hypothetical protein
MVVAVINLLENAADAEKVDKYLLYGYKYFYSPNNFYCLKKTARPVVVV